MNKVKSVALKNSINGMLNELVIARKEDDNLVNNKVSIVAELIKAAHKKEVKK